MDLLKILFFYRFVSYVWIADVVHVGRLCNLEVSYYLLLIQEIKFLLISYF